MQKHSTSHSCNIWKCVWQLFDCDAKCESLSFALLSNRETAPMLASKRLLSALALTLIGTTAAQAADEVVVLSLIHI